MTAPAAGPSRIERRRQRAEIRTREQERRWSQNRFAVPHRTDGAKVTLGVAWFVGLLASIVVGPVIVAVFVIPAAAIAALQTAHAWARVTTSDRQLAAAFAVLIALPGLAGDPLWLGLGAVVGTLSLAAYGGATLTSTDDDPIRFTEVMVRSVVPVAVAAGSLLVLAGSHAGPFVALVAMVSAYEVGDFVVGSGAENDVEGPAAGLVALALVGYGVSLLPPDPLTASVVPFVIALTALSCVLGQLLGSALLPRGDAWAPGLRRLDSYLLAAPLWVLLVA